MVQPLWRTLWWCLKKLTEKAMATHSVLLAWKIPWMVEPGRLQSTGSRRVGHNWATSLSLSCTGEGNGNPFQCSHLENPRDGGAWWTAVYGVAQSRTRLKQLSSSSIKLNIEHCDPATPLPGINLNKLNTGFQTSTCTRVHSNAISEQQVILNSQLDSEISPNVLQQMKGDKLWYNHNYSAMYVCVLTRKQLFVTPLDYSPPGSSPQDFPGKNIRVGSHFLLQGNFLTQGSNPHLLHWQADSLPLSHQEKLIQPWKEWNFDTGQGGWTHS